MTPAQVIQLLDHPETLMRRCYLHIAGGAAAPPANGPAQIATFAVSISAHQAVQGFTTGISGFFGITKDRPFVRFTKQPGAAVFPAPADHFNAYYIPMVQTGDVGNNTSHYTLPTGVGALDIMVTSKLSGCTFSVGSDAVGAALVSHVQPNAANLAGSATLSGFAQTGMAATRGEFRKTQEYGDLAGVIGHRNGAVWTFYMQAGASPTAGNYVISNTRRL